MPKLKPILVVAGLALLAGCKSPNDLEAALKVTRSTCPAVGIPAYTNDVTLFDPPAARTADAIDTVATIENLASTCNQGDQTNTLIATFDVDARRIRSGEARDLTLPYYATVVRAGTVVTSKTLGQVTLHFDAGQARAMAHAQARIDVNRAAASLPDQIVDRINRKRKAGDIDAAVDPMSDPQVRTAVQKASFELLVGFQLTNDQLRYNASR